MRKTYRPGILGISLLVLCCLPHPAEAQRTAPGFQQQIKRSFNQAKDRVAGLFGRQHPAQRQPASPMDYADHSNYRQPPQRLPHAYHAAQRQQVSQHNPYPPALPGTTRHAGYTQQPMPDATTADVEPAPRSLPPGMSYSRENATDPMPVNYPAGNPGTGMESYPSHVAPNGWGNPSASNYQDYVQSETAMQTKPPTVDYYNEHQYGHFSNRISATERAILLEDELVRIRTDKKTLESQIQSLEAQLKQRDYEIEQLHLAVDDALEQLSTAAGRHRQLQQHIRTLTAQRNQEKAASEKLLDELRRQLNDLLANELVGSG